MVVRLGILSCARISNVIAAAAKLVDDLEVVAVASRTAAKAAAFAETNGIARACSYAELVVAPEVDAVFVPLPSALATEWAVKAAEAGKHILVDKPFASVAALQAILDAVRSAHVIFLDGTHWVHSVRAKAARDVVRDTCGEPQIVRASFTAPLDLTGDIRTDTSLEPQGVIGDLGWYCSRTAVHYLGTERTAVLKRVACFGSVAKEGWVRDASGVVEFAGGERLSFDVSFKTVLRQRVEVAGTTGTMRIDDFVIPRRQFDDPGVPKEENVETEIVIDTGVWVDTNPIGDDFPSPSKITRSVVSEGRFAVQPVLMLREFVRMITSDDSAASAKWAEQSMNTQRIVDALYADCMAREKGEVV